MEKALMEMLKNRRIELNLTMKDVANKVGVSEGTISRWESGNISNMRRDRIYAYAKTLHVSPEVVMGTPVVDRTTDQKIADLLTQLSEDQKLSVLNYVEFILQRGGNNDK